MSANIKASTDGTQAIIGVGGVDQMTVSNAGVVTANSFVGNVTGNVTGGTLSGNASSATALATGSTTARTLANRFADVVNVKDFLCDDGLPVQGDGIHDDTTGIQAALNYAIEINKPLRFGSGVFYHATAINYVVSNSNRRIRILLDGGNLKVGPISSSAFDIDGSSYRPSIYIQGPGRFIGTELINVPSVGSGSYLIIDNCDEVSVSDLGFDSGNRVEGKGDSAIVIGSCRRVAISNCQFRGWNDHGIYFSGPAFNSNPDAMKCDEAVVTGCIFNDVNGAIRWARSFRNLLVSGNIFKDCYNCVIAAGGNTNWMSGNSINITGNLVDGCDSSAFDLRYFEEGVVVSSNLIYDWGLTVPTAAAINLRGISKASVVGNTVVPKNATTDTGACNECVYIISATNPNDEIDPSYLYPAFDNVITGNVFGVLYYSGATRNAAITDQQAFYKRNTYALNRFQLDSGTIPYWCNQSGVNVVRGCPNFIHPTTEGFGIGTVEPQGILDVGGKFVSSASPADYIAMEPGTASQFITAYSSISSAQKLFINATTDVSHTTPTGGEIGLNLRVLDVDKILCGTEEVYVNSPLRLKKYSTSTLPTTGITEGTIAYDNNSKTVKFFNGSVWANI